MGSSPREGCYRSSEISSSCEIKGQRNQGWCKEGEFVVSAIPLSPLTATDSLLVSKQRAANILDDDDDFIVSKPQAKKAAPKKAKAAVPLPASDDVMEVDEPVKKVSVSLVASRSYPERPAHSILFSFSLGFEL